MCRHASEVTTACSEAARPRLLCLYRAYPHLQETECRWDLAGFKRIVEFRGTAAGETVPKSVSLSPTSGVVSRAPMSIIWP